MKFHENTRQKRKEFTVIKYSMEFVTALKVSSCTGLTYFDEANSFCLHRFPLAILVDLQYPIFLA